MTARGGLVFVEGCVSFIWGHHEAYSLVGLYILIFVVNRCLFKIDFFLLLIE